MQVLTQVLVLFLIMALGCGAARGRLIGHETFQGINKLVLYFTLPCLSFIKLQQDYDPGRMGELGLTFLLATAAMLFCGSIGLMLYRKQPKSRWPVFMHLIMFSNCGFMGYPIISAALGEGSIIYAVMYVASFNLLTWTVGVYLYAGVQGVTLKSVLLNPTLLAVVAGILCFVGSVRLPTAILSAMTMLGDTTTPLTMLVVGSHLSSLKVRDLKDWTLLGTCLLRLLLLPMLLLGIMTLLHVPEPVKATIFVCSAMPGAAVTAMQAEYFHGDSALGSRSVAVSTALSVLTIPAVLMLL